MIAVVGGGISGLVVGRALADAGADFVVLEATTRPGGVIRSIEVEGRVLELGPQRMRLSGPIRALVAELGVEGELLVADRLPLYVWADGRLREVPTGLGAALRSDLLRPRDRLRLLAEPLTPGLRLNETAAEFFIRKLGRRLYDRLVGPLFGGLYASDPADMPSRHALAGILPVMGVRRSLVAALVRGRGGREAAPACSFDDGMQALTDALARTLGDRLRIDTPVRGILREGGRFRLALEDDAIVADHVVLACPADAAAAMLAGLAPDAADRLGRLRYNPLALVHLLSDADLRGLGYQVAFDAGRTTRGVTWNHALFGRDGQYTAFLGGARDPGVADRPDAELAALAAAEFREMTGYDARPIHVSRALIPAWDRTWDALDGLELPAGISVCANWAGRVGIVGRVVDGLRVAERLTHSRTRRGGAFSSPRDPPGAR